MGCWRLPPKLPPNSTTARRKRAQHEHVRLGAADGAMAALVDWNGADCCRRRLGQQLAPVGRPIRLLEPIHMGPPCPVEWFSQRDPRAWGLLRDLRHRDLRRLAHLAGWREQGAGVKP